MTDDPTAPTLCKSPQYGLPIINLGLVQFSSSGDSLHCVGILFFFLVEETFIHHNRVEVDQPCDIKKTKKQKLETFSP